MTRDRPHRGALPQGNDPLTIRRAGDRVALAGRLAIAALPMPDALTGAAEADLSGLTGLDTAGAWLLDDLRRRGTRLTGLPERVTRVENDNEALKSLILERRMA